MKLVASTVMVMWALVGTGHATYNYNYNTSTSYTTSTNYRSLGIDVSQSVDIGDFHCIKSKGYSFIIVRAYRQTSDGSGCKLQILYSVMGCA